MPDFGQFEPNFIFNEEINLQETRNETEKEIEIRQNATDEDKDESQPFDQLLAEYGYEQPRSGQLVSGTIVKKEPDYLLVDIGAKRDAVIPARDLGMVSDEIIEDLKVGDEIQVVVLRPAIGDNDLLVSLNKGIQKGDWITAQEYYDSGGILELEVIGHNRGGLLVQFESIRGFLPHSQVPELQRARDHTTAQSVKSKLVGEKMKMKIIEINPSRNRLIFSVQAAMEKQRVERLQELEVGQIVEGPVVNIVDFGAFINLGAIDGLIHISELDWQRIDHPSEILSAGEVVEAKVLEVDIEQERVSLSRKSILVNPWEQFESEFNPGDVLEGKITNVVKFGAFVELPQGIEGLIHSSELGYSAAVDPTSAVQVGDQVLVKILSIEPERERIALSMRQVPREKQIAWAMEILTPD